MAVCDHIECVGKGLLYKVMGHMMKTVEHKGQKSFQHVPFVKHGCSDHVGAMVIEVVAACGDATVRRA